jgi:ADP-ribose pyrophosphatase
MRPWKTLSRRTILNYSKFLAVESHTVELPDGRVVSEWPWVVTPDYVNVAAVTEDGEFLCFRQTKYSVEGTSFAPVGGYLEPGEDPLAAAQRELLEETGYEAPEWINLGRYAVDGNRGAGTAYFFLARDARRVSAPDADDLEEQKLFTLGRSEIEAAIASNEFKLLPWAAVVALTLLHLDKEEGRPNG